MFNAGVPSGWPWERRDWKPTPDDRVRELVKAGALYVAEAERIRAEVRSIVHAIDDLRGTDSFAGTGPSLWTRLSYWLRPYDAIADRRRWRWQRSSGCFHLVLPDEEPVVREPQIAHLVPQVETTEDR